MDPVFFLCPLSAERDPIHSTLGRWRFTQTSPNELYIGETWENITKTRQGWEEVLKSYGLNAGGQQGWKWCNKCRALFMGDNAPAPCAKGGVHDSTGSGDYTVNHSTA